MGRRALVTAAFGVLCLTSACGGAFFSNVPSPSPVTADTVRNAVDNSTMQNAHFRVSGTLGIQGNHFPLTGDGVLQRTPSTALSLNMTVETNTRAGNLTVQEVVIGGRTYARLNGGKWTSTPDTSTISPTAPTTYVGEEAIGGVMTWHASTAEKGSTYDIWVRETDGYIVYIQFTDPASALTMNFDIYNKSPVITAPV
jgi:hypothetical protein